MYALADCNSFYCSCERVFHPETRGRPIIVLSNNDGCAISFSKEARAIGFGQMCEPYFETIQRIKKHKVAVFSSNYALYDDMSKRVMSILGNYTHQLEVYSIDEAFLSLHGFEHHDMEEYGRKIRKDVLKMTGLPIGIGIAPTKVLSKIANRAAKKNNGVLVLDSEKKIDEILKTVPVRSIWGVGSSTAKRLNSMNINTAYEFKTFHNDALIQKIFTKTGREIQEELRGVSCLEMEVAEMKENTATTRSFGKDIYKKEDIREAIATFATKTAEKLRDQNSVCYGLTVFIHTNRHKDIPQYHALGGHTFLTGTSDTIKIIKTALGVVDQIFKPGYGYKKGGVILNHIVPKGQNQMNLFGQSADDNDALSSVIDDINRRYGPKTIKSLACGITNDWKLKADFISKRFTTRWEEILRI